jgi:hypothetical protein
MGRRVSALAACAVACVAAAFGPAAAATAGNVEQSGAIVVFYAADPSDVVAQHRGGSAGVVADSLLSFLGEERRLRVGLWSSTQGSYQRQQILLDISQGTRQPTGLYSRVDEDGDDELDNLNFDARARTLSSWQPFRRRAHDVSTTLRPGLLGGSVPGGGAFRRCTRRAAADRNRRG